MSDRTHHQHTEAYRRGDHSPEALEHEVNAERGRVSETLDALHEKLTIGGIADDLYRSFGHYGGAIGRNLGRRAADNPLPLILTGIGLAWLMFGSGKRRGRAHDDDYLWDIDEDEFYDEDFVGTQRYGAVGARPYGTAGVAGPYEPDLGADPRVEPHGSTEPGTADKLRGAAASASHSAGNAASSASHPAGSAYASARGAASSAGHAAGSAYESARGAASSASRRVGHAAGSAYDGAYSAAEAARRRAAYYGRYTQRRLDGMIEEQPLVVGALALAIGAAIGGALPRTRTEDEYMGEYSDEAWDMAATEAEKARRVAGAVADEARHIADEKAHEFGEHAHSLAERAKHEAGDAAGRLRETATREAGKAKSETRDAAGRLSETAKAESKKQNLGDPKKPAT